MEITLTKNEMTNTSEAYWNQTLAWYGADSQDTTIGSELNLSDKIFSAKSAIDPGLNLNSSFVGLLSEIDNKFCFSFRNTWFRVIYRLSQKHRADFSSGFRAENRSFIFLLSSNQLTIPQYWKKQECLL